MKSGILLTNIGNRHIPKPFSIDNSISYREWSGLEWEKVQQGVTNCLDYDLQIIPDALKIIEEKFTDVALVKLHLFCSDYNDPEENKQDTFFAAQIIKSILLKRGFVDSQIDIHTLTCKATDGEELTAQILRRVRALVYGSAGVEKMFITLSGGTSQMKNSLLEVAEFVYPEVERIQVDKKSDEDSEASILKTPNRQRVQVGAFANQLLSKSIARPDAAATLLLDSFIPENSLDGKVYSRIESALRFVEARHHGNLDRVEVYFKEIAGFKKAYKPEWVSILQSIQDKIHIPGYLNLIGKPEVFRLKPWRAFERFELSKYHLEGGRFELGNLAFVQGVEELLEAELDAERLGLLKNSEETERIKSLNMWTELKTNGMAFGYLAHRQFGEEGWTTWLSTNLQGIFRYIRTPEQSKDCVAFCDTLRNKYVHEGKTVKDIEKDFELDLPLLQKKILSCIDSYFKLVNAKPVSTHEINQWVANLIRWTL